MITESMIIEKIKGINGDFTTRIIGEKSDINRSALLYKTIKKLLEDNVIELVQKNKGREPAIYRVKKISHSRPVGHETATSDQKSSYDDIFSITNGSISMMDFGNAIFHKMLRLGTELTETNQQIIHQQSMLKNQAKKMDDVHIKLMELSGRTDMPDVDIFTLIAHIADVLSQERAVAAQVDRYHEERKQNEKLKKELESLSNAKNHLMTQNEDLRQENDDLKKEISELILRLNTNAKGRVILSSFRDLGKACMS